jgi:hypothetical protein
MYPPPHEKRPHMYPPPHTQAQFYALLESNCTLLEKGEVSKDEVELAEVFLFFFLFFFR